MSEQHKEQQQMQAGLTTLHQQLSAMSAAQVRQSPKAQKILDRFISKVGGEEAVGDILAEKFMQVMDDPDVEYKETRAWLRQSLSLLQKQEQLDSDSKDELAGLTEQELYALLRPVAVDLLKSDPAFLKSALADAGITVLETTLVES